MQTGILATKVFIPPNRPDWVARPRLLQKLDNGLRVGNKLAMVSAPAGSGKTTLVTGWVDGLRASSNGIQTAWLSLDAGDNDLAVFFSYLIAALRTCEPAIGEVTASLLAQPNLPAADALLLPLVNDLTRMSGRVVLVLDDYHVIQLPTIHEALALLIERQPPNMQVVITTRQDPLLPLARWRARGMLTEIRLRELRFNEEEVAEFLSRAVGSNLRAEDIAALENRTEGWIAGLQLAAISLSQSSPLPGDGSITEFIHSFTGNDRFVMDYLLDEVLVRQPGPVQQFLLHTSVLERFNSDICQALLENNGGETTKSLPEANTATAILSYLDQANLFLISLDNQRQWYRYHHLFAELLQYRLRSLHGRALVDNLKRNASLWFDANGFADEAIRYAQSAEDWQLSCRLIEKHSPPLMQRGEQTTVVRWLSPMPEPVIRQNAALCRYYGYILTVTGKLEQGETTLRYAEQAFPGDADHLGSTLAFASYNACFRGDFRQEIEQSQRALDLLPAENQWMRGLAAISLGLGLCHTGDPEGCEAAMKEALAAGWRSNNTRTSVHALTYLGRISVLRLDFAQAERYFRQACEAWVDGQAPTASSGQAPTASSGQAPTSGPSYLGAGSGQAPTANSGQAPTAGSGQAFVGIDIPLLDLAQMKYEQNDLEQSMETMERGMEANRRSGGIEMRAYGYRIAARLHQLRGDMAKAHDFLKQAIDLAREYTLSPLTLSLNAACQVEMALAEGNLHQARLAAGNIVNSLGLFTFNFFPEMARVRFLLAQGNRRAGLSELEVGLARAEKPGWEYPAIAGARAAGVGRN